MSSIHVLATLALLTTSSMATTLTARAPLPDPTLLRRQNVPSCTVFGNIESSCAIATAGFSSLSLIPQLECLCYQSSTFAPTVFDGAFNQCLSYYKTASPSFYSASLGGASAITAPCSANANLITSSSTSSVSVASSIVSSVASVRPSSSSSAAATGSATITSAITTSSDVFRAACTSWEAIQDACSTSTPGFSGLPFSDEASCLCYVGTRWSPLVYDGYWSSCLHCVQTYNGTLYSQLQTAGLAIPTPCQAAGNVRQSGSSSSSATSSSSASVRSTSSAPASTSSSSKNDGNAVNGATSGWITKVIGAVVVMLAV